MAHDVQLDFLKTLCILFDGNTFVPYPKIKEAYPDCPSEAVLDKMIDKCFIEKRQERYGDNEEFVIGYLPTPAAFSYLENAKSLKMNAVITIVTAVIAGLSCLLSLISLTRGCG